MKNNTAGSLFVWRNTYYCPDLPWDAPDTGRYQEVLRYCFRHCPYCSMQNVSKYHLATKRLSSGPINSESEGKCSRCGFHFRHENGMLGEGGPDVDQINLAILKRMKVDDAELGLDELGTHLKRKFNDIYSISPRRFEELVADIYRHLGYEVRLTKSTRDGGFDAILLDAGSDKQIIVECKKYSRHRKVGIEIVRELLGAQVLGGFPEAKLVTSSYFTLIAKDAPNKLLEMSTNFQLDLVDADQLFRNLGVYNKDLPPLYLLQEGSCFKA